VRCKQKGVRRHHKLGPMTRTLTESGRNCHLGKREKLPTSRIEEKHEKLYQKSNCRSQESNLGLIGHNDTYLPLY
jgi:hypothetical protein